MKIDDLINELIVKFGERGEGFYIDEKNIGIVLLNLLLYIKEKENEN